MILALDLGATTGWAMYNSPDIIISGYIKWKSTTIKKLKLNYAVDTTKEMYQTRPHLFKQFKSWLEEQHKQHRVKEIVFEAVVSHKGTHAAHMYGGYLATLSLFAIENAIQLTPLWVGEIKKSLTGKGNADKEQMVKVIQQRGFTNITNDNEADAVAMALFRMHDLLYKPTNNN